MTTNIESREETGATYDFLPRLKQFAYLGNVSEKLEELSVLAESENWDYQFTASEYNKPILYSFLIYTFDRIEEENKIAKLSDGSYSCFNTGLVTANQEPIFALFEKNRVLDRQPWFLHGFLRRGDARLSRFSMLPPMAHYFDDPSELIFDTRMELRVNYEHMIQDNKSRFPVPFNSFGDYQLQTNLRGAIENSKERVARNYKAAVPQYHKGRIQLLLPLCLSQPGRADLAIVVERLEGFYRAATCLTLDMAYNNARLLARPDRDWLQP